MSYGDKYIAFLKAHRSGVAKRIRIKKRNFSGEYIEVRCGESACRLKKDFDNDPFKAIVPTIAEIELESEDATLTLFDLFSENEREYLVVIEKETAPNVWQNEFTGWLEPWVASEENAPRPYTLKFSAVCGLGHLQQMPFLGSDGKQKWAVQTVIQNLFDALYWTGFSLPVWASSDLLEECQIIPNQPFVTPYAANYGLFTVRNHSRAFQNSDGSPKTCWDALEALMVGLFQIMQDEGAWRIYQLDVAYQQGQNNNQRWWKWTTATATPVVAMGPCVKTLWRKGDLRPDAGGKIGVEPSQSLYHTTLEYGRPWNELKNGDFSSWNGVADFTDWIRTGFSTSEVTRVGTGKAEDPYRLKLSGNFTDRRLTYDEKWMGVIIDLPRETRVKQTLTIRGRFKNVRTQGAKISLLYRANGRDILYYDPNRGWMRTSAEPRGSNDYTRYFTFHNSEEDKALADGRHRAKNTMGTFEIPEVRMWFDGLAAEPLINTNESHKFLLVLYRGTTLPGYVDGTNPQPAWIEIEDIQVSVDTYGGGSRTDIASETHKVKWFPATEFVRKAEEVTLTMGDAPGFKRYNRLLRDATGNAPTRYWSFEGVPTFPPSLQLRQRLAFLAARVRLDATARPAGTFTGSTLGECAPYDIIDMTQEGWKGRIVEYERDLLAEDMLQLKVVQLFPRLDGDLGYGALMTTTDGEEIPYTPGEEPDVPVPPTPPIPKRPAFDDPNRYRPQIGFAATGKVGRILNATAVVNGKKRFVGGILDKLKRILGN